MGDSPSSSSSPSATRLDSSLYIKVIEAKDVKQSDFDCYATVKIDGREVTRTRTIFNSPNPFWDEEHLSNVSGLKEVEVILWEVKGLMFQDQPLGKVTLDYNDLKASKGSQQEKWLQLYPADTEGSVSGEVKLELTLTEKLLNINLISASDLAVADVNGLSDPYVCFHLSTDVTETAEQRSKVKKKTLNPKYGESFKFDVGSIRPDQSLVVTVWDWDRFTQDDYLGYFQIPLSDLQLGKSITASYPLRPKPVSLTLATKTASHLDINEAEQKTSSKATQFAKVLVSLPKEQEPPKTPLGAFRLKFKFTEDVILPAASYDKFMKLVASENYLLPMILGKVSNDREDAAWALIKYFQVNHEATTFLSKIINQEVEATLDANTIFRGNSMSSKAVDVYMKLTALPYLHDTVGDLVKEIITSKKNFEVDPTRLDKGDDIRKNWKNAKAIVTEVLAAIFKSRDNIPRGLSEVFSSLRQSVKKKWPENEIVSYTSVAGFIFLRLFVAAILSPNLFGLWGEIPDQKMSRSLTIVAKTVQNAANLVHFGQKEAFMEEMNEVIEANIPEMKKFLEDISVPKDTPTSPRKDSKPKSPRGGFFFRRTSKDKGHVLPKSLQSFVETDLARECSKIYHHFSSTHERIAEEFQREGLNLTLVNDLKVQMDELKVSHEEAQKQFQS